MIILEDAWKEEEVERGEGEEEGSYSKKGNYFFFKKVIYKGYYIGVGKTAIEKGNSESFL